MSDIFKLRLILEKIDELRELIEEWENNKDVSLRDLEAMKGRYYLKLEYNEKQAVEDKP